MKQGVKAGVRFLILVIVALACLLFVTSIAQAQEFQAWNEVDFAASLGRFDLLVPFVSRVHPGLSNPQLVATGLTADLHLPGNLTLTSGYLFADLPQTSHLVHLPLMALTTTLHPGRLLVADRNRFEKLIGYPGWPVRYRNRLLLDVRIGRNDRAHAFVGDEVVVNLSGGSSNQNRFQVGAGARLNGDLLIDLYYLQRTSNAGSATCVFGTTFKVSLARPLKKAALRQNP